jgi:hypothetical protein
MNVSLVQTLNGAYQARDFSAVVSISGAVVRCSDVIPSPADSLFDSKDAHRKYVKSQALVMHADSLLKMNRLEEAARIANEAVPTAQSILLLFQCAVMGSNVLVDGQSIIQVLLTYLRKHEKDEH